MSKLLFLYPTLILSMFIGIIGKANIHLTAEIPNSNAIQINQDAVIIPQEIIQEMIDQVDQVRALTDLRRLTGVEPICTANGCTTISGRETESEGLQWAKDYIYETLIDLYYSVEVLDWEFGQYADQNILARKEGLLYPDQEIYFIAHLDGYLSENPAADDDASGVVSLLELARVLTRYSLSRTVVLFFSTGEEHGALGAHKYVDDYSARLDAIKYLVSVEMLGYDLDSDGRMELWNGTQPVDFVQLLSEIIDAYPIDLVPEIISGCT